MKQNLGTFSAKIFTKCKNTQILFRKYKSLSKFSLIRLFIYIGHCIGDCSRFSVSNLQTSAIEGTIDTLKPSLFLVVIAITRPLT